MQYVAMFFQRCFAKILAIPHLNSVKWQQAVKFQHASLAACQVANTVGAPKKTIPGSKFAMIARQITGSSFQFEQKLQERLTFRYPFSKKVILTLTCNNLALSFKGQNLARKEIAHFRYFGSFDTMVGSACHRTWRFPHFEFSIIHRCFLFGWSIVFYWYHHHPSPTLPIQFINTLNFYHVYFTFARLVDLFRARHCCKLSRVSCFCHMFFRFVFESHDMGAFQWHVKPKWQESHLGWLSRGS